ncbi:MAG: YqiA/YcfP family alpha/beta fold hydrolase [Leptolyngbyaceae cyanobacterium]
MDYLYLHGFASGPQSAKAQFLKRQFAATGRSLTILDLNQADFTRLTLSRQIQQAIDWIDDRPQVTIIGSSFGGLTACWIAQQAVVRDRIHRLVLLAPAFQFLAQWLPRLGADTLDQWRHTGQLKVYHYGFKSLRPLAYAFVTDTQQYDETHLTSPTPVLVLHGRHDEVISIQASRAYAASRAWVSHRARQRSQFGQCVARNMASNQAIFNACRSLILPTRY